MALIGGAITPYAFPGDVDHASPIAGSFPFSPIAWGFLSVPGDDEVEAVDVVSLSAPLGFVMVPESKYLEPTIGQIWPR